MQALGSRCGCSCCFAGTPSTPSVPTRRGSDGRPLAGTPACRPPPPTGSSPPGGPATCTQSTGEGRGHWGGGGGHASGRHQQCTSGCGVQRSDRHAAMRRFRLARALGCGTRLTSDCFEAAGQVFRIEVYPNGVSPGERRGTRGGRGPQCRDGCRQPHTPQCRRPAAAHQPAPRACPPQTPTAT